ncbi:MAG: UDP-N-acetylmuramate:L-alanyl-gamma-D-glutamyl-meso-diaminopimelate ligase, partial [Legionellaceae bacterium]
GYEDTTLALQADCVIVGNAIKRGMPVIDAVLDAHQPYTSGPEWLARHVLPRYRVLAVAGTHGKTTTTSMLAFILHEAGLNPGFLIGGVSSDFKTSACLGKGPYFVIEADEYDSAFFDKRPKFMHYRPDVAILNNLEFDHADIYPNLDAIEQQFHYFLKTIPPQGVVIHPKKDEALNAVLARGHFSRVETFSLTGHAHWHAKVLDEQAHAFEIFHHDKKLAEVQWSLMGRFNIENGLAALAASTHAGVEPGVAARALERFTPVKRRLEVRYQAQGITLYDDFAHHPTAIKKTIQAVKHSGRHRRLLVVLEFASYTMRTGVHREAMADALQDADLIYILKPREFSIEEVLDVNASTHLLSSIDAIVGAVGSAVLPGDAVLVMSNRGFEHIHQRLIDAFCVVS